MKPVSQWTIFQKVLSAIATSLVILTSLGTVAVWGGDTRWQKIAEADTQARRISDYVNIEQYNYRREQLITQKVGKPPEIQERMNAEIQTLTNRINSLEKKYGH